MKRHKADAATYSGLGWRTDTGQCKANGYLEQQFLNRWHLQKDSHGFTKDLGTETHIGVSLPSSHYWYSDVIASELWRAHREDLPGVAG